MKTEQGRNQIKWMTATGMPLIRVKPGPDVPVIVAGPMVSYYVHWCPELDRTQPCYLYQCPYCGKGHQRRPMSYIGVLHWRVYQEKPQWVPAILEVPFNSGRVIIEMAGKRLALNRMRKCAQINIGTYLFQDDHPTPRPLDFDMQLLALWRVPQGRGLALVGNLGPGAD